MDSHLRYSQLHFFLDESGSFRENGLSLVGGVLVLGPYDQQADTFLRYLLQQTLQDCGGVYPADLHFFQSSLPWKRRAELCQLLRERLTQWCNGQREINGIALRHRSDVFVHASPLLAEREYDNRYLQMLCTLIEYVCFVDVDIKEKINQNAEVYIYVSRRSVEIEDTEENRKAWQNMGYRIVSSAGGKCRVTTLSEQGLLELVRAVVRDRWSTTQLQFRNINVLPIDYNTGGMAQAVALYLADIELGCLRTQQLLREGREPIDFLPPHILLNYAPPLQYLLGMQSALTQRNLGYFLDLARRFWLQGNIVSAFAQDDVPKRILAAQKEQAATLVPENVQAVMTLLTEASRIVDRPGQAYTGLSLSDFAADILNYAGVEVPEARFVALQTELSAANHLGEYERADEVWQSYKQQEEKLLALGLRGLELMAEISNRRAVALIDQFRFDDAHQILQDVLSRMEQSLRPLGEIGGATAPAPIRLLGTLYGTLGQAYALQTEPDHLLAEKCFRQALQHFQEPADRERQWVYLGHLACDKEQGGETLWQEVCANLPQLNSHIPICQEGRQYQLALQIKGIYRFRPLDQVRQFLQAWQSASWQSAYSQESREQHPFGLIHQGIGMLWLRLSQETKDKAAAHAAIHSFDAATQHMREGGSLLQVLAYFADIRRWLITLQCSGVPSLCERRLRELLQGLQGHVVEHYGERVWNVSQTGLARGHFGRFDPGPDCPINLRAQAILAAVRFNYW